MRLLLLALASFVAHAQDCPPLDAGKQKADEQACRSGRIVGRVCVD
jgi:hypothetical protein